MNWSEVIPTIVTCLGIALMVGMYRQQIRDHGEQLRELRADLTKLADRKVDKEVFDRDFARIERHVFRGGGER